jgi:hypothetical protein
MRRKNSTHRKPANGKRDLAEIKELLGPLAATYTDAQLDQLSHEMAVASPLLLGLYFQEKGERQRTRSLFDSEADER